MDLSLDEVLSPFKQPLELLDSGKLVVATGPEGGVTISSERRHSYIARKLWADNAPFHVELHHDDAKTLQNELRRRLDGEAQAVAGSPVPGLRQCARRHVQEPGPLRHE